MLTITSPPFTRLSPRRGGDSIVLVVLQSRNQPKASFGKGSGTTVFLPLLYRRTTKHFALCVYSDHELCRESLQPALLFQE